jgi:hypothetical protein
MTNLNDNEEKLSESELKTQKVSEVNNMPAVTPKNKRRLGLICIRSIPSMKRNNEPSPIIHAIYRSNWIHFKPVIT